jgi:hypothetical protein
MVCSLLRCVGAAAAARQGARHVPHVGMHIHSSNPVICRESAFNFCPRIWRDGIAQWDADAKIGSALPNSNAVFQAILV